MNLIYYTKYFSKQTFYLAVQFSITVECESQTEGLLFIAPIKTSNEGSIKQYQIQHFIQVGEDHIRKSAIYKELKDKFKITNDLSIYDVVVFDNEKSATQYINDLRKTYYCVVV